VHYSARTALHRKDFELGWNRVLQAGGVLIGEMVTLELEIEVEALKATVPAS
jgi:polyisoprenoid-binding protein YceI